MMLRVGVIFVILFFASPVHAADGPATAPAKQRVVCFGDSITKGGYPALLGKAIGIETLNAGVGGNTTANGLRRMQGDVLDRKPTVVVILFGTNDCRLAEPAVCIPAEKYQANLVEMIDRCQKIGAKVVLMTLPPINPEPYFKRHRKEPFEAAGGLDKVIAQYRAAALKAAESKKVETIDLNTLLGKVKQEEWLSADGVHPTPKGYELIAGFAAEKVKAAIQ